jgi:hypothetical protein
MLAISVVFSGIYSHSSLFSDFSYISCLVLDP